MHKRILVASLCFLSLLAACSEEKKEDPVTRPSTSLTQTNHFSVLSPPKGALYVLGDTVRLQLAKTENAPAIDSVEVFLDGQKIATTPSLSYDWVTTESMVGQRVLRAVIHFGEEKERERMVTTLLSDVTPEIWSYRVVSEYPHDNQAFVQGLEFHNGYLYESTGQKGQSTVRKVNLSNGEVLIRKNLDTSLFGEGLTKVGDELIQLTWQARVGIIYDFNTLEEKKRFNYPTEGWGLAYTGEKLVMSDGSNKLYFMQPGSYVQGRTLTVFNDKGPVGNLNELEFIDGVIYANVWQTDDIIRIDPASGKVLSVIQLTGILPSSARSGVEDVLNGIAYDAKTGRTFVTGKNWPKLFEVQLFPKP